VKILEKNEKCALTEVVKLLPAACCLLPAACCLLPAACCLLPAAYLQDCRFICFAHHVATSKPQITIGRQ
jgi:hypothetical protein